MLEDEGASFVKNNVLAISALALPILLDGARRGSRTALQYHVLESGKVFIGSTPTSLKLSLTQKVFAGKTKFTFSF